MAQQVSQRLKQFIQERKKNYLKGRLLDVLRGGQHPLELQTDNVTVPEELSKLIRKSEFRKNSLSEAKHQQKPYLPEDSVNSIRNRIRVFKQVLRANNELGSEVSQSVPSLNFQDAYKLQKQKYEDVRKIFKTGGQPTESNLPEWKLAAEQENYKNSQARFLRDLRTSSVGSNPTSLQVSRLEELVSNRHNSSNQ